MLSGSGDDSGKMMGNTPLQTGIDERNIVFWNELCGTQLARGLGVHDDSQVSLSRFDAWYLGFYPYLEKYIPYTELKGLQVLEIGLGYGTVSQRLAESGARYHGLDIADGPVKMVNHRLRQNGLPGRADQGSILHCPFEDNRFDYLVSIGCFHHTGNIQGAVDEAWRVLKPGGRALIMVYNAYSYRRLAYAGSTLRYLLWDKLGLGQPPEATERERAHYDSSASDDSAAPETKFTSAGHFQRMAVKWTNCSVARENIGQERILNLISRDAACRFAGPVLGLDLYCSLTK